MPQSSHQSLWHALNAAGRNLSNCFLRGAQASLAWAGLVEGSALGGRVDEVRGRSVLVAAKDQLTAALALFELDGVARRMVLWPPDLAFEHLPYVIASAAVDAVVSDVDTLRNEQLDVKCFLACSPNLTRASYDRKAVHATEWILLTSGTTGQPKLVVHSLASLTGAIKGCNAQNSHFVWSTFYDIRRYGGLQILLRAVFAGASLVLSGVQQSAADFLVRVSSHGVTHISGTPSHWRRALMSPSAHRISPQYVRLSGEIADQAILSQLQSIYPHAKIAHAFASTEAGVAFEVADGLAGFPVSLLRQSGDIEMKVENGSLRIRSARTADHYLDQAQPLKDTDGFVDTGDVLELRGGRYHFVGRRDGVINVGGLKVHPEEVEAVVNSHPQVHMSLVRTRKSPITGALVVADVVLKNAPENSGARIRSLQRDILLFCRRTLPSHKVPTAINFVPVLAVTETGKLLREHA